MRETNAYSGTNDGFFLENIQVAILIMSFSGTVRKKYPVAPLLMYIYSIVEMWRVEGKKM